MPPLVGNDYYNPGRPTAPAPIPVLVPRYPHRRAPIMPGVRGLVSSSMVPLVDRRTGAEVTIPNPISAPTGDPKTEDAAPETISDDDDSGNRPILQVEDPMSYHEIRYEHRP